MEIISKNQGCLFLIVPPILVKVYLVPLHYSFTCAFTFAPRVPRARHHGGPPTPGITGIPCYIFYHLLRLHDINICTFVGATLTYRNAETGRECYACQCRWHYLLIHDSLRTVVLILSCRVPALSVAALSIRLAETQGFRCRSSYDGR